MIEIGPRQAEVLSYIQGRGPAGLWVFIPRKEIRQDLSCSSSALSHLLKFLRQKGLIERRGENAYRVLRRLEDSSVRVMRRELPRPGQPPKKKLIPFPGAERRGKR